MKFIGLTGGIGSGKSKVASLFATLGIPVYESDARARQLMNTNEKLRESIERLFGSEAYLSDRLNSAWIASKVFKERSHLEKLNAIVHPVVANDAIEWANSDSNALAPYVLKESAILFEENLTDALHGVILVVAPANLRIDRVMKRDGITQQQVEERIQNQWPDERKIILADYVIYNDGERSLIEQVMDLDKIIRAI